MAENQVKTETSVRTPLLDVAAARASLERAAIKQEFIEKNQTAEGMKPTLTPANITSEQVGRIAGKLYNEGIKARGGAEKFKSLVASPEETRRANEERSQHLAGSIAERYKEKQKEQFKVPQEAKDYRLASQAPPPPSPFASAPQLSHQATEAQEPKGGLGAFFRRLFKG